MAAPSLGHAQEQVRVELTTAEIVDLLTDVSNMREATGRAIVVDYISEQVRAPLLLPDLPQPKYYLYHLVHACKEIPDGLQVLVHAVEFVAGQTAAVARLKRMLSPVRAHLEPVVETQVEDLLTGLRVPSLTRLYVAATGNSIATVPFRLTDAWDAFSALLDHNTAPGKPSPHLIFVAMLLQTMQTRQSADNASTEEAWRLKRLREWMTMQTEQLRGGGNVAQADYLDRMRDRSGVLAARDDKPIYLIIQLEPLPELVEGRVMCAVALAAGASARMAARAGEDQVVPLDAVPEHVGALIHEAERGWAYELDDSLVLEFVLPLDMINLGVDQWTRDEPEMPDPTPLGADARSSSGARSGCGRSLPPRVAPALAGAGRRRRRPCVLGDRGGASPSASDGRPAAEQPRDRRVRAERPARPRARPHRAVEIAARGDSRGALAPGGRAAARSAGGGAAGHRPPRHQGPARRHQAAARKRAAGR